MVLRIIKQGSERESSVQQFIFAENFKEMLHGSEKFEWPPAPSFEETEAKKEPIIVVAEPKAPAIDVAKLERAAFDSGYLQGQKSGKELAEQKLEAATLKYSEALQEVSSLKDVLRTQVEREVVKLAVEVAKKIVYREIRIDPAIIQTLVRVALSHVADKSSVTIHLSPVDYTYLLKQRPELAQAEGKDIAYLADNSIEQGGCLIRTECGDIDARIEEKFREVENAFFEGSK
jgi:flagellar assembly protein FliH